MNKHAAYLHAHRAEDVAAGRRSAGTAVLSRQIMWARWIEVAVEHELQARLQLARMKSDPESDAIVAELRASLVAISACAHTIDALHGDIKYLVAPATRRKSRERRLADAFGMAFGDPPDWQRLGDELAWLFDLRDFAVHPYTEDELVKPHPSGVVTDPLAARFNAVEAGRAVELTMRVLAASSTPTSPGSHWIERWVADRSAYHTSVVEPLRERRGRAPRRRDHFRHLIRTPEIGPDRG